MTLCAATSVNVAQTIDALHESMRDITFGKTILFTDADVRLEESIQKISISPLKSGLDYSRFVIRDLGRYIRTDFIILIQWDGFIINGLLWNPNFRSYDYIGASWPQFPDRHCVGNGGFSWRSRKILEACQAPDLIFRHPEDLCICRDNRVFLEENFDIRFAPREVADRFSFERFHDGNDTFGFHGVFNFVEALGAERFWSIYLGLDDKKTVFHDYRIIMRSLMKAASSTGYARTAKMLLRMTADYVRYRARKQLRPQKRLSSG